MNGAPDRLPGRRRLTSMYSRPLTTAKLAGQISWSVAALGAQTSSIDNRHVTGRIQHMINSFADRRTQELYATGKAKRFPPDAAKRADRKLEYVIPSPLTTSGASAFGLLMATPMMWKFATTIKMRCDI